MVVELLGLESICSLFSAFPSLQWRENFRCSPRRLFLRAASRAVTGSYLLPECFVNAVADERRSNYDVTISAEVFKGFARTREGESPTWPHELLHWPTWGGHGEHITCSVRMPALNFDITCSNRKVLIKTVTAGVTQSVHVSWGNIFKIFPNIDGTRILLLKRHEESAYDGGMFQMFALETHPCDLISAPPRQVDLGLELLLGPMPVAPWLSKTEFLVHNGPYYYAFKFDNFEHMPSHTKYPVASLDTYQSLKTKITITSACWSVYLGHFDQRYAGNLRSRYHIVLHVGVCSSIGCAAFHHLNYVHYNDDWTAVSHKQHDLVMGNITDIKYFRSTSTLAVRLTSTENEIFCPFPDRFYDELAYVEWGVITEEGEYVIAGRFYDEHYSPWADWQLHCAITSQKGRMLVQRHWAMTEDAIVMITPSSYCCVLLRWPGEDTSEQLRPVRRRKREPGQSSLAGVWLSSCSTVMCLAYREDGYARFSMLEDRVV